MTPETIHTLIIITCQTAPVIFLGIAGVLAKFVKVEG